MANMVIGSGIGKPLMSGFQVVGPGPTRRPWKKRIGVATKEKVVVETISPERPGLLMAKIGPPAQAGPDTISMNKPSTNHVATPAVRYMKVAIADEGIPLASFSTNTLPSLRIVKVNPRDTRSANKYKSKNHKSTRTLFHTKNCVE